MDDDDKGKIENTEDATNGRRDSTRRSTEVIIPIEEPTERKVRFGDMEPSNALRQSSTRHQSSTKTSDSTKSLEDVHINITLTWSDLCYDVEDKRAKGKKVKSKSPPRHAVVQQNGSDDVLPTTTEFPNEQDQSTSRGEVSTRINVNVVASPVEEEKAIESHRDEDGVINDHADEESTMEKFQEEEEPQEPRRGRRSRKPMKRILHHVDGSVSPGEIVAILGPSGSGKTTLLNILAGRVSKGVLSGSILANGSKRTKSYYTNTAYVEQDDLMFPTLTVLETLKVAALLRLPASFSREAKLQRVDEVIQELGLYPCRNTYIGGPEIRGISGGERKRTAIAVELLRNPSMLFLDEPTSGLDSTTAFNIVESLQKLARRQRTVLMTIHQPKANIFELFDKAIFLSQGKVVFFGPVNELVPYFSSIGHPCPQYANPADHYMDVITIDPRSPEAQEQSQQRLNELTQFYKDDRQSQVRREIDDAARRSSKNSMLEGVKISQYQANYWDEFHILAGRSWKNFIRNKRLSIYALAQTLLLAVIIGGVFFGVNNGPTGVQNRVGALFFIILNQSFSTLFPVLNVFPSEIAVFKRERAAQMYRVSTYYLAKNFAELPLQLMLPLIFGVIVYWMIGFKATASAFFTFLAFTIAVAFTSQSIGLLISAAVPDVTVANIIAPLVLIIFVLFGGFYSNTRSFWPGIAWIQWISYINYAFKGLVQNEFRGVTFCASGTPGCMFSTGEQVIAFYDAGTPTIWVDFVIVIGFGILFKFLGFFVLLFRSRPRRQLA